MRFTEAAEIREIPIVGKGFTFSYRKRVGKPVVPGDRTDRWGEDQCWAIARARELEAQLEGRIYDVEWPVYWHVNNDLANVFISRDDSFTNVDLLWANDSGVNVPVVQAEWKDPMITLDREGALNMLRHEMMTHTHFGRIPCHSEMCPPGFQDEFSLLPAFEPSVVPRTALAKDFIPSSVVPRTAEEVGKAKPVKPKEHKSLGRYRKSILPEVVVTPAVVPRAASRRSRRSKSPVVAAATLSHVDRWIADTGCGYDLIQLDEVMRNKVVKRPCKGEPIRLDTANGLVEIKEQVALHVPEINEEVRACVLEATPAVLSVGRRCMEHGYAFHWEPGRAPILVCPGGNILHLGVEHYVPYLSRGTVPQPAVAAAVEGGASSSSDPSGDAAPECALAVEDVVAEAEDSDPPGRDLKAEAASREHMMTHMPKNKWCPACQRAKMQHKACRRGSSLGPVPESFGDQVTADHIISRSTASQGLTGEKNALVLLDRATGYIECYPLGTKSSSDTWDAFNEFLGPAGYVRSLYTDDSPELIKTAKDMKVPLAKAIPGRPSTNGVAERAVRSVVEGARTILEHAGLPARFWKYAVRHWCFSRNVSLRSGESSWNLRFGQGHFKGPKLPFGCWLTSCLLLNIRRRPRCSRSSGPRLSRGCSWDTSCSRGVVIVATTSWRR